MWPECSWVPGSSLTVLSDGCLDLVRSHSLSVPLLGKVRMINLIIYGPYLDHCLTISKYYIIDYCSPSCLYPCCFLYLKYPSRIFSSFRCQDDDITEHRHLGCCHYWQMCFGLQQVPHELYRINLQFKGRVIRSATFPSGKSLKKKGNAHVFVEVKAMSFPPRRCPTP